MARSTCSLIADTPYWGAFSGGKDSITIYHLTKEAGVDVEWHYNITSADPPELVQFIKQYYPDVKRDLPEFSMWQLILREKTPPTRLQRYCCRHLKERGGDGRTVITGVRWAESVRRQSRGVVEIDQGDDRRLVLMEENDESRRMVEHCPVAGKHIINPIIDWTDNQVWSYIRGNRLHYCFLYDEGFLRLGCVGCPQGGGKQQRRDFRRWPKFREQYVRTFDKMLEIRRSRGLRCTWSSGEEVMAWWTEEPEYPLWDALESDTIAQESGE